ncbi:MAG TPA: RES family NAD+ phosphorylase [Candidatus Polarisedimenticolaceae bacterium]|nr:RES family NAD+ phosphorylase [Candidatus Polarisedimenticolaceae bacterium]
MLLWRICPRAECPRAFAGADTPGRWNQAGTRLVYASESRALAALEYLAHAEDGDEDTELVAIAGALPDDASVERVLPEDLPQGWDAPEHPQELRRLGSTWAESRRTAVLSVPSALVPGESNLLLNPAHPEARQLSVHAVEPFRLDPRLTRGKTKG